jgi:hypothetical protein
MAAPRVLGLTAFSMASPPVYVNSILPASKSYLEVVEKSLLPEQATIRQKIGRDKGYFNLNITFASQTKTHFVRIRWNLIRAKAPEHFEPTAFDINTQAASD